MDLDEMQSVWDEQKQRTPALELDALREIVLRRGRRLRRGVETMEISLIVISFFVAWLKRSYLQPGGTGLDTGPGQRSAGP